MITSARNPKIQLIRVLQDNPRKRREAGVFVIEGVRLLEEAASAGIIPDLVLYTPDLSGRGRSLVDQFTSQGSTALETAPHAFKAASDTETPQGILAVCPGPVPGTSQSGYPILVLDQLRDPGNLGTILRTAAAFGVPQVLLPPETADPFSPKALRAGMGAQFRLKVLALTWVEISAYLAVGPAEGPLQILLASAGEGLPFTEVDFRKPTALIIGSEAEGVSREARDLAHASIHIPMPGGGESLNAAVAAGILLFETARQKL